MAIMESYLSSVGFRWSFVRSRGPGAPGMAVMEEPIGWLREHGRPEPRDDSTANWDLRP